MLNAKEAAEADVHHVMQWECVKLAAQVHAAAKLQLDIFLPNVLLGRFWPGGGVGIN